MHRGVVPNVIPSQESQQDGLAAETDCSSLASVRAKGILVVGKADTGMTSGEMAKDRHHMDSCGMVGPDSGT